MITTRQHRLHRGFSLSELATTIVAGTLIIAILAPALRQMRHGSGVEQSIDNLTILGIAHHIYAADWNGRQHTQIVDDLSAYGDSQNVAFLAYREAQGGVDHPPIILGWSFQTGGPWGYYMSHAGNWVLPQPLVFSGPIIRFGAFRIPNAKSFHDYVSGRLYAPEFYAPNDTPAYELVEPIFDEPEGFGFPGFNNEVYWSSYCSSPAAMFDPQIMRHPDEGGWQNPWSLDEAFTSPSLSEATYPSLKTQMIEHHWNQGVPDPPCNPAFVGGTYDGCEPYYFNHSIVSQPATLFYDLTVRLLPVAEAVAADAQVLGQTGHGLWSRDTPFGEDGYFSQYSYDLTQTSFHIFTTEGIHGRDTVDSGGAALPSKPRLAGTPSAGKSR